MTAATLLGLLVSNRLRLGQRLLAQAETRTTALGDVGATLRLVMMVTMLVQSVGTAMLFLRFLVGYDPPPGEAAWLALFHTVMAFNNAGFVLFADDVTRYALDAWVLVPLMAAVAIGGIALSRHLRVTARTVAAVQLVSSYQIDAHRYRYPYPRRSGCGACVRVVEYSNYR